MSPTSFPWVLIPAQPYDGDDDSLAGSYVSPASVEGADGNPVCVFGTQEGSGLMFENEADHNLITAAPDLLEALKGVVYAFGANNAEPQDLYRALVKRMENASAAIAKAEGRA